MFFKGFRLFAKALNTTRHEMWISLQVLIAATLLLSLLLYWVEHQAQPDVFTNYWDALLWSFMGYIDDPGEFATYTPITFFGRLLKVACAIINIAIFAVPAGLIASGFSDAIAEDKREKEIREVQSRLRKSFSRKYNKVTNFRVIPRYVPLIDVQVSQEIDTKDIIDSIRKSEEFRLTNLAMALPASDKPIDRLVIELIPQTGKTSYGCCIDRGSKVTIVATSAVKEVGMTNFAYYVALFGGFNYVSKEYLEDKDAPMSFYIIANPSASPEMEAYLNDLKRLSQGEDRWTIMLIVADSVHSEDFFFVTQSLPSTGRETTIIDAQKFENLYANVSETMKTEFGLMTDLDNRYVPVGPKNVGIRIGGGNSTNAFTLRVDWSIPAFNDKNIPIAFSLACMIASTLEGKDIALVESFKQTGFDYQT